MHEIRTLSNELKIVYEKLPYARSVAAGVWVLSGSRSEELSGMSHFIEHMLFKGTKTKTAREIAEAMDATGGQLNAYTTREYTGFYSITTSEHMKDALEMLSDMVKNSRFSEDDIATEKNVVAEEIAMYEDSPEDLVFDLLEENAFFGNPLGRSITGTKKSVEAITRGDILKHMEDFYVPENMVISVAGNFSEETLLELCEDYFGSMPARPARRVTTETPMFHTGENTVIKDIEQANLAIGYESFGYNDDRRYPLIVLNSAFGGGMSSRLFQKVREESGLAYSVYTSVTTYRDTGVYAIYAGLKNENLKTTRAIIEEEIDKLLSSGLTEAELDRAKEQVAGGILLGGESTSSHMSALGKGILLSGRVREEEELIGKVRAVTCDDVLSVARDVFKKKASFTQIVKGK